MQRIKPVGNELVIPLFYEMNICLEASPRFMREKISPFHEKRLLGEAWSSFWGEFVESICHPDLKKNKRRFARSEYPIEKEVFGRDIDGSDIHEAFIFPLDSLGRLPAMHESDPGKIRDVFRNFEVNARPSFEFIDGISTRPMKVQGRRLADAVGFGFNDQGEKEFGVVFSAELLDFYAEEGSLRAAGMAALTFFGTTLLGPLVTLAVSTPSTDGMSKLGSIHRIEKNLSVQDVQCDFTAGFHFSRPELIMKLEHKLSVGGKAGICEVQSALAALGYSPGKIDGIGGPDTKAAAKAFANAWRLSPSDIGKPVFFNFLARALTGDQPPYK